MANDLSVTSGVVALATFAFQASTVLHTTIRSFQSQDKGVRALKTELADLIGVLESLLETVSRNPDINFEVLKLPLFRCGKTCEQYGDLIAQCTKHSSAARPSFRDWISQQYLGGDITDFKDMLAGYKSTLKIALVNASIRIVASITPNALEEYKDMILDATSDLQEHLKRLDKRIQNLAASGVESPIHGSTEWLAILGVKESTLHGLKLFSQLYSQIEDLESTSREHPQFSQQPSALKDIRSGLGVAKGSIHSLTSRLQTHENDIDTRMEAMKLTLPLSEHEATQLAQLKERKESIRQCLDVVSDAHQTSADQRYNTFEDIRMADDRYILSVSTVNDFVSARRFNLRDQARHMVGQLDQRPNTTRNEGEEITANLLLTGTCPVSHESCDSDSDFSSITDVFSETKSLPVSDSSVGSAGIQYNGIRGVASALLSHSVLRDLFTVSLSSPDKNKCRAYLKGSLKAYADGLKKEAGDHLEARVATFIESMAGRISDEIRRAIVSPSNAEQDPFGWTLERQLATIKAQGNAETESPTRSECSIRAPPPGHAENQPQSKNDDELSEPGAERAFEVTEDIKRFILSARATDALIAGMKSWLKTDDHPDHAGSLNNLGNKLARRYDRTGAIVDLEEAISVARQVVAATPNGDPNQTTYLHSLANRLQSRYERTDTLADLEEALSVARQVLQQLIGRQPLAAVGGATEESLTAKDNWHSSEVLMEREVAEATATRNMDLHNLVSRESFGDTLRSLVEFWGLNDLLYDMIDIFMPPVKAGYRRLRWRCSCGIPLWGDFDNADPEALQELLEELHHVPGIVKVTGNTRQLSLQESYASPVSGQRTRTVGIQARNPGNHGMGNQGIRSVSSSSVPRGLGTTVVHQGTRSSPLYNHGQPVLGNEIGNPTSVAPDPTTQVLVRKHQFFEVCIRTGNYAVRLREIDLAWVKSDGDLFAQIWTRYRHNCGYGIRRIFLKPRDVHFVMFSVCRSSHDLAGIHRGPSEYPPQEEVDQQRYHYRCPRILMPGHLFIHYLHHARKSSGNDHMHNTWLQRLPKKLDTSILEMFQRSARDLATGVGPVQEGEEGDIMFGWGAHILEGPNRAGLSLVLALGIVLAFVTSCVIVGIAKTAEQGFGVGQFLMAVVACVMAAIYFDLKDQ